MHKEYMEANRKLWDTLTPVNADSRMYDMEGFLQGKCTLLPIEVEEVGDVTGKRLLHLQCQFGQDTLSWARRGAVVTGIDFSEEAITLAKSLAAELEIPADFIECNLYDVPQFVNEKFDIVFTSAGVLCWLPDLFKWAEIVSYFLKPGGVFYIREFHPTAGIFDDENEDKTATVLRYPYARTVKPLKFDFTGSYADPNADINCTSYEWMFSFADVINPLIKAGLQIEFLHEFNFSTYQSHPFLSKCSETDGYWRYAKAPDSLPLMFSIRAHKK